jgi:serine/threonine-protein kinase
MSTVYQSYDVGAGRPVAVKLLADHLAGQPEFVGRFYREARLSRAFEHPNVVQGYSSGFDPEANKHFLVMELVDGPSAHGALVRLGRRSVGMVVRIGIDIARALEFLHDREYVHRDVKPDNVLLHPGGGAKLADLGLAKRLSEDAHLTALNQGVGTSYYMPYEQAVNANLVDGRSDIFALGATLYHLITGEVPFRGSTHDEVVREKWGGTFRPVRAADPTVPVAVAELIEATLACDPRARVQRVGDLAAGLEATGLATRLPSFALDATFESADHGPPADDAPTRTDLRTHLPLPPEVPARPPAPPTGVAAAHPAPPAPDPRARAWPWLVGTGAVLLGLLASQAGTHREPAARAGALPAGGAHAKPLLPHGTAAH